MTGWKNVYLIGSSFGKNAAEIRRIKSPTIEYIRHKIVLVLVTGMRETPREMQLLRDNSQKSSSFWLEKKILVIKQAPVYNAWNTSASSLVIPLFVANEIQIIFSHKKKKAVV